MLRLSHQGKLAAIALGSALLWGCGDSSESGEVLLTCSAPQVPNAAGTQCVDPEPIQCPAPSFPDENNEQCIIGYNPDLPAPVAVPGENEAVLYYNRMGDTDESYVGYKLHTWNNEECDAYAPPHDSTDWANGHDYVGIDPNYGAYWILNLKEGYGECGNFIIHIGTEGSGKALGDFDAKLILNQADERAQRMSFTFHAHATVYEYPILSLGPQPLTIDGASAHWLDADTLLWNADNSGLSAIKLHYDANAGLELMTEPDRIEGGQSLELVATTLTPEQAARVPHLAGWPAYSTNLSADEAKAIAKAQMLVVGYDAEDLPVMATGVQHAKVLDALYTFGEADADEAALGVHYEGDVITASVWAPTAQALALNVYDADKNLVSSQGMTLDEHTGVWSHSGDMSLDRQFYRYEVTVYHPLTGQIETIESTDPYSLSLSANGRYSQFVNLEDDDLKPAGWDGHTVPTVVNPEDAVIYEGHVRDFSARDESTPEAVRGKYLAFAEQGTAPVDHLSALAQAGMTHFHVLPVTDMATVKELREERVEITDTLGTLCEMTDNATPACATEDHGATILSLLEQALPGSADAQELVNAMRGLDGFNWGYDPHHFIVPEGSYASDPDGVARILELRAMNQALHEMGLRVVLDVVYNHTSSSGLWDNSVFDKLVPGYYHRYNEESGDIERSTCCENTATEHRMMDKFVSDSLVILAQQYGYDGFRFDIMGHHPKAGILAARDAVQAVDPDNYFYGEGWNFGEVADNRLFVQAKQADMAGSEVGTFNDRIREAVRQGRLFAETESDERLRDQDTLRLSMAGNLQNYVLKDFNGNSATGNAFSWNGQPTAYALDPADSINYVSKHDNETLWDQLHYHHGVGLSLEDRVRVQHIAATVPLLSQGIPFLQMGGDMLRSKSMDRNTYDAGDWFNYVDFTKTSNNWNVGLPLAQDNQNNWETIAGISANPNAQVSMQEIDLAATLFQEVLSIRRDSPLLRLTSEADVVARLGFHNVGKRQTQGVIVMSLDDGIGLADLDPMVDAMVVMVNGSANEVSHTVPTAAGFELHPTLTASLDSRVRGASFAAGEGEGTFTVPALTTAVFIKPQVGEQGEGLSANATVGAPDVVPYGSTEVFVRGSMNGWGEVDSMTYVGDGEYRVAITLAAGDYEFKVASADWSTVDFGGLSAAEAQVEEGVAEPLRRAGDNLHFNAGIDATYVFSLDASDAENPILTVFNEEPFVGTPVYLRGSLNGWSTDNELAYLGGGIYRVDVALSAGDYEFKVASEDWSTVDYGSGEADPTVTEGQEELLAVAGANMLFTAAVDTTYAFIFDASDLNEPTLAVYPAEMFGTNVVYVRGSMNGWGEVDMLSYQGLSSYSVDIVLEAGDHEFKVATGDWSTVDLGAIGGDEAVVLDAVKPLASKGANMTLSGAEAGTYRFTVTGPDIASPTLTVSKLN
ncbi:pullulanase-type alpha-1,6-glucosidase [Ferrimonas balearica]|uniref:pullulanase-type alpha-1,6-glucosidase n=1 Tax=Ferrimonas balearica TaxID=44012 RepID=UPI001C995436|nr:pullulanase-type alpha-1,6-glucosidase [Ferrimonas balearica]MBY5991728.1 pullulanase-type alpha-1,6-glucosidase [Ferrimonas balearica]